MPIVRVPTAEIFDWPTFHDVFARVLGFPGFYGRNMDAWIDCLTCADEDDSGMVNVAVPEGDVLTLLLEDATSFAARCPEQYTAVVECAAFVNWRRIERDEPLRPILALAFDK
jgi:hypothetical protein